jgi:hypothetical protein
MSLRCTVQPHPAAWTRMSGTPASGHQSSKRCRMSVATSAPSHVSIIEAGLRTGFPAFYGFQTHGSQPTVEGETAKSLA